MAVVLIVVGTVGLFLSSGYSGLTYRGFPAGYSTQLGGYGGMGPGRMMGGPSGMMESMMQMMGGNMLVSGGAPYNPNGSLVNLEQAKEIAERYLAAQNNPDLELGSGGMGIQLLC